MQWDFCAPRKGPQKGKDYGHSPGRLRRPAAGFACGSPGSAGAGCARISGQAAPTPGVCAGGKPPPAGRSGVAGTGGAAAEVAAGDLPCGRPRTLYQPAEIMRMPAKKCEIVSKPAAICEKPDLLIV